MKIKPLSWMCCILFIYVLFVNTGYAEEPTTVIDKDTNIILFTIEQEVINKTNIERIKHGLSPLTIDKALLSSAREHCWHMVLTGSMHHNGSCSRCPNHRVWRGENIAMGYRNSDSVIRGWMNSSGHRANMLNPRHTKIGVAGYGVGIYGIKYWCQQFK